MVVDSPTNVTILLPAVQAPSTPSSSPVLGDGLRVDFPVLHQFVNDHPLVYLDNAATSQKPKQVILAMSQYYEQYNSNVHRGVHALSAQATVAYEDARDKVARFVNARSSRDIVFTRNATEGINLVAYSWGMNNLKPGDEVLLSVAEHHSNLVPWQLVAQKTGAVLKHVTLTPDNSELDMQSFSQLLSSRTKIVALSHVSNVLGSVLDTDFVCEQAHGVGAKVLLDCCQSVPHMPVDVQSLGADWIVASSHKMCGPTGIGFLWGKPELLESMPPWMGGGEMIQDVYLDHSSYAPPPGRFEAGTPAIAEAIGLGAACDYLSSIGMAQVHSFELDIGATLYERLSRVQGVTIYGPTPTAPPRPGLAPLHAYLGVNASARASPYIYNTDAEVDSFVRALDDTIKFFKDT
ncbi:MAG: hypothetical protein WDW38_003147 [Sanguina aurantia]